MLTGMNNSKCDNCGRYVPLYLYEVNSYNDDNNINPTVFLCNASCLVEWAWKQKEAQPKLSKSKQ